MTVTRLRFRKDSSPVRGLASARLLASGRRALLALAACVLVAARAFADAADPVLTGQFERAGVEINYLVAPASRASGVPRAGELARVRFTIRDSTTQQPVTGLHPAAWLSRKSGDAGLHPQTAAEKVREFLGGSIFARADLDLNTYLVLVLNDNASVSAVDPQFGNGRSRIEATVALPGSGEDWALSPDGTRLFVTVPSAQKIAAVDTTSWSVRATAEVHGAPHRMVVQPDGHYAWATVGSDEADAGVTAIEAASGTVAVRLATGSGPREILFSADSRQAFVVNAGGQTLSVIDVPTLRKIKDVPLGFTPASAAASSLGAAVVLTDPAAGELVVVDTTKLAVTTRIKALPGLGEIRFLPNNRYALVAVPARRQVLVFDVATNRVVQSTELDGEPNRFGFSSDMAFVICRGSATIRLLPFPEIGREGQAIAVADFPAGDHGFGPRLSPADTLVATPGEPAVVVSNPDDRSVYYYMEGMAAPMGSFSTRDRTPRAVLTLDRSLRERAPGIYETTAILPAGGAYDLVFFLDSPRLAHCFDVALRPADAAAALATHASAP